MIDYPDQSYSGVPRYYTETTNPIWRLRNFLCLALMARRVSHSYIFPLTLDNDQYEEIGNLSNNDGDGYENVA